jgi:hypothetical protein
MRRIIHAAAIVSALSAAGCIMFNSQAGPGEASAPGIDRREAERAITRASEYKFGQDREPLTEVEGIVQRAQFQTADRQLVASLLAEQLRNVLPSNEAKRFFCRQLAIIGTPNEVPDLIMAVRDPKLSDMARYALEPMEDRGVDEVLLGTLPTVGPEIQVGIINTLAVRKSYVALDTLRELRKSPDPAVAAAASHAVGRIEGMIIP